MKYFRFNMFIASVLLFAAFGVSSCGKSLPKDRPELGLTDIDYQIIISDEHAIPPGGTYAWGAKYFRIGGDLEIDMTATDKLVTEAFRTEMEKRNFREIADSDSADLIVGYAIAKGVPLNNEEFNNAYGEEFDINFPVFSSGGDLSYRSGAFLVDIIDRREGILLWRGAIMGNVDQGASDEIKEKRSEFVMAKLFEYFPRP